MANNKYTGIMEVVEGMGREDCINTVASNNEVGYTILHVSSINSGEQD